MAAEALEDIALDVAERAEIKLCPEIYECGKIPNLNPRHSNLNAIPRGPTNKSKRKKTSFVWDYFTVSESDIRKAVCNNCGAAISRGKDTRSFGTTSLASHIKFCYQSADELDNDVVRRKSIKVKKSDSVLSEDDLEMPKIKKEALDFNQDMETYVLPTIGKNRTDVICSKRMDLVHSGSMMNVLYEQHKSCKFCDLTLISAPIVPVQPTVTHSVITTGKKGNKKTFQAHSFVLAALSSKIKTLIEMGSRTIELKDVTPFGLKLMLEIVYTGKLKRKTPLRYVEVQKIWKAASDLGVKYVHDYLANEHPSVAKWILEEENRHHTQRDVYEIIGDEENGDLVDLCGAIEESARDAGHMKPDEKNEQLKIQPKAKNFAKMPQSTVEITFSQS